MGATENVDTLVLDAMRLAERAHRTRPQGPHHRKAPAGEDRPAYFIHLAEVGWMLQDLKSNHGLPSCREFVFHPPQLARGWRKGTATPSPRGGEGWGEGQNATQPKTTRNTSRALHAIHEPTTPDHVRALSCADKTSNMRDMNRLLAKGHPASAFTKQDHATQLNKFQSLYEQVFKGHVPEKLAARYREAMEEFRRYGK